MHETNSPADIDLGSLPLFRNADEPSVRDALVGCELLNLPADTPLLRPGESNHNVYIPVDGRVVVQLNSNGEADSAFPIRLGECVGEMSAVDGKPVSALVITQEPSRVLRLPHDVFWGELMTVPGVAANVMSLLSERLRRSTEQALKAQSERLELQHLRKELDFARQLQTSMLPLQRPLFPERNDVSVCGFMEPAFSVGGDLFDAFFVSERELFFCIGDVSGHGIASAMFMARAIGLLRILAMTERQPDALLTQLNYRLCANNETNLFLTIFCGFVDLSTGRLIYSNGGHCPPLLDRAGHIEPIEVPKGPLIGVLPGARFSSFERMLAPGEILYCYTDGVTESQDPKGEEFTEHRCMDVLSRQRSVPLERALHAVREAVVEFTHSKALEDDFTMLALQRQSAPLANA
jgi:phosphoserine phosphatase RsbU/P